MANALDTFRAQREAVDQMHARLGEVSDLLARLRVQVDGLALHKDLKDTLRDEQMWLARAQQTMQEVRRWREIESHRVWSPVLWRWAMAFAYAPDRRPGWPAAGYAWMTEPHAAELERLRRQASFSAFVERRLEHMTPADVLTGPPSSEFERLMGFDQEVAR
jgi:hypothetical protein